MHAKGKRHDGAAGSARGECDPVVSGDHRGRKAGDGGDEHHPLGAEVDDAGSLVDQQPQRRPKPSTVPAFSVAATRSAKPFIGHLRQPSARRRARGGRPWLVASPRGPRAAERRATRTRY